MSVDAESGTRRVRSQAKEPTPLGRAQRTSFAAQIAGLMLQQAEAQRFRKQMPKANGGKAPLARADQRTTGSRAVRCASDRRDWRRHFEESTNTPVATQQAMLLMMILGGAAPGDQ
jgi:hypothetical protein